MDRENYRFDPERRARLVKLGKDLELDPGWVEARITHAERVDYDILYGMGRPCRHSFDARPPRRHSGAF